MIAALAIAYLYLRTFVHLPEDQVGPERGDPHSVTGSTVRVSPPGTQTVIRPLVKVPTNSGPKVGVRSNITLRPQPTNVVVLPPTNTAAFTQRTAVAIAPTNQPPTATNSRVQDPPVPPPTRPIIKVASVDHHKFPGTDSYEELRTLTVSLRQVTMATVDSDAVTVDVAFFDLYYDANSDKGQVLPSQMLVPKSPIRVAGPWRQDQPMTVTATYTVPIATPVPGRRRPQFYGFSVRVFYAGVLQDHLVKPTDLQHPMTR